MRNNLSVISETCHSRPSSVSELNVLWGCQNTVETALCTRCFHNTSLPLKQSAVLRSPLYLHPLSPSRQPRRQPRNSLSFHQPLLCFNISLLLFIKVEQTAMPVMVLSQCKYHRAILLTSARAKYRQTLGPQHGLAPGFNTPCQRQGSDLHDKMSAVLLQAVLCKFTLHH